MPPETIIEVVADSIQTLIQKPDGVSVELGEELDTSSQTNEWTLEELDLLFQQIPEPTLHNSATQHIHVLFLDGNLAEASEEGAARLGFAWGGDRIVIFRQAILDLCQALAFSTNEAHKQQKACQIAGAQVWIHELGHLLGLVDNGLTMQEDHSDPDHQHHDIDSNCVMYWASDTKLLMDKIKTQVEAGKEDLTWFCTQCQTDVLAAQSLQE